MAASATFKFTTSSAPKIATLTADKNSSRVGDDTPSQLPSLSLGPNPLTGPPSFLTHHEERKHIVVHMAAAFRNWARVGFTEGISGHMSMRDPEHSHYIWMNAIGKHFALLNGSDMVCIDTKTATIVGGNRNRPVNAPGFFIHSEIHKKRLDVHAICHAHTISGRAWATFGQPLDMITQDVCDLFGVHVAANHYGGIVTAEEEGRQIAQALGPKGKAAILLSHGLITVGSTVDEAHFLFGLLDRSCEIQLRVEAARAGNPKLEKHIIPDELARFNFAMAGEKNWLYAEAQPDLELEIVTAGDSISAGLNNLHVDA